MKDNHSTQIGISDPLTYTCTCPASESATGGLVLLFYRYYGNTPILPTKYLTQSEDLQTLESWHRSVAQKYQLKGKIRIAKEGFNITVGGTIANITDYIATLVNHWTFSNLQLTTAEQKDAFFKPTPGCSCVFPTLSIKTSSEITPMGVTNYIPSSWTTITPLRPSAFHTKCHESPRMLLLDVRNHYESRIGYFVDPRTGEAALRPPIRRFSQFPQYVKSHLADLSSSGSGLRKEGDEDGEGGREIMSYCTGGIRCEKGVRFLYDQLSSSSSTPISMTSPSAKPKIYTLDGGIAAYISWMDVEIAAGRKKASESLFKGKNYVFDARGSMGLEEEGKDVEKVAECHGCGKREDRMRKCKGRGCHLVLVVCEECERGRGVSCCDDCALLDQDADGDGQGRRMCACERQREDVLWGKKEKIVKTQGWKKQKRTKSSTMDIHIKLIE